ncbi:MAG: aminopeptidase P family protein [Myxococcales bacterium]|jgi:Xaa-Pro aminopeptidase
MHAEKKAEKKKGGVPAKASHDIQPPQPLIDFMMTGWEKPSKVKPQKVEGLARFKARRRALSKMFRGETLVVPTGHEKIRANDTPYHFRPGSDFFYLTGNKEPDCVLVLVPKSGGHESVLFVEPEVDRSTPAFFTDRARGALWVGPRLGLAGSKVRYGVDKTMALGELSDFLANLKKRDGYRVLRGMSAAVDQALPAQGDKDAELASTLAEMRRNKDAGEIESLRKAIASTKLALEDAIRAMKPGKTERDIEAAFDARARREGMGPGFATIVAAGHHACILHWTRNDGALEKGKLVQIDAGVESNDLYTADITRTFPVSGKFTREQRKIYDIITAAQDAAIAAVKPGNDFMEPHRAATKVLVEGLEKLGILKEPAAEALREDRQTYKRYTLHSVSHFLGIDVHDSAAARPEKYRQGKLEPGMVITVEPGLYFQPDDLTVPPRFRGIGIRVEEDVLVTRSGHEVLSAGIPRKSKDVEAWIAKVRKSK